MKSKLMIVPVLLFAASACHRENTAEDPEPGSKTMVSLTAAGEENIEDLNIYVFNIQTGKNTAHVFTKGSERLELPYGNYEIYALANAGKDLGGGMTLQGLKKQRYTVNPKDSLLIPMCGSETVELSEETGVQIELVRCPAKVDFDISVDDNLKNMVIQSIQLKSTATTGLFFPTGGPAENTSDMEIEYTEAAEKRALSRSYILGENCAGTVATITSQREKCEDNAPDGATYLLINALSGNRFCTYRVFLGENNTTDFNIRRNSVHKLQITIRGEDEIDTRMESDPIEIEDDMEHADFPGACIPGDYHLTFLPLRDNDQTYTADIELVSGDPDKFSIDGYQAPHTLSLGNMASTMTFPISYSPLIVDTETCDLEYNVTVRSGNGNVYTKTFTHKFCNQLFVYISYPDQGYPEGGDVEPEGDFTKRISGDRYRAIRILVPGKKETMKATCEDGFALDGWYRGLYGKIITQNENYTHTITTPTDTLAMKFKREKCFIYTDIENVQVFCLRKDPILIEEKSAYVVDTSSFCSIRGKDLTRFIAGWYDDPVLRTEDHLISLEPEYSFTPTENMKIYPQFR